MKAVSRVSFRTLRNRIAHVGDSEIARRSDKPGDIAITHPIRKCERLLVDIGTARLDCLHEEARLFLRFGSVGVEDGGRVSLLCLLLDGGVDLPAVVEHGE